MEREDENRIAMPIVSASVRGEGVSDTIVETLLEDVLKGNGEEHLLEKIMELALHVEDDPPVIFGWENVCGFVQAIQAAQAQAATGVTVQNFKEAVLEYVRVEGAGARLETACLPCTQGEFGIVTFMLRNLDFEPWIQRVIAVGVPNSLPIACVYVPHPRSDSLERATPQFPNSLWG